MRYLTLTPMLALCVLAAACSGAPPADMKNSTANTTTSAAKNDSTTGGGANAPSVATSHGSGAAATAPGAAGEDKPPVETKELDDKIEKAEAKAKAAGASAADKDAAAKAHLERGNFFYNAGDKRLYRYALGDFRRALAYQPNNDEAKEKIEMIESIYKSLGRPIPNNGLEP